MKTASAAQLSALLKRKLAPAYLLSGDEPLLLGEAADAVRAAARRHGFESREVLFADARFDWDRLAAQSANLSLFAERRILEVRLPTGKPGKAGAESLAAFVASPPEDTLLVIISGRVDKRGSWVKAVAKAGVHVEVWPIDRAQLPAWIMKRMQGAGLKCARSAAELLADRVEGNLLAADQEIRKLRLSHGQGSVDAETLMRSVADSSRFDVFKLGDTVLLGDAGRAIRIMNGLRGEGVAVQLVLWALNSAVHDVARVNTHVESGMHVPAALAKAGIWTSRREVVRAGASRLSLATCYRLIEELAAADLAAKGHGPGDAWAMLGDVACEIAGRPLFAHRPALRRAV
ncbi:MAG: DNA polymerase III subunit delta [Gammaproteobacteria bacterium]|nr:DNA polymerase III subunit delta [Gammaproteobacteria bacterium]